MASKETNVALRLKQPESINAPRQSPLTWSPLQMPKGLMTSALTTVDVRRIQKTSSAKKATKAVPRETAKPAAQTIATGGAMPVLNIVIHTGKM